VEVSGEYHVTAALFPVKENVMIMGKDVNETLRRSGNMAESKALICLRQLKSPFPNLETKMDKLIS
jgi:hypothetical protein